MCNLTSDLCISTALKSPQQLKYAAIIVYRNKVVATGYNYVTDISSLNHQCLL
jgi:hypothetical protein